MSKSLRVEKDLSHGYLFKIAWNGGGEVPDALKGHYTNHQQAMDAITAWVAANPDRNVAVEQPASPEDKAKPKKQDNMQSI